jgi:hypothetical protein
MLEMVSNRKGRYKGMSIRTIQSFVVVILVSSLFLWAGNNASAETVLLENDFHMWEPGTVTAHYWTLQPHYAEFKFPKDSVALGPLFSGSSEWTDYAFEIKFRVTRYGQYGNFRMFLRSDRLWYGYSCSVCSEGINLFRFEGNYDLNEVLYSNTEVIIEEGVEYVVTMEVQSNRIRLFINGDLISDVVDDWDLYPSGGIGVKASNVEVEIYGARVTTL